MDLTSHEHRIDLLAAVINCDITLEMDLSGFRIDIYDSYVRAERERKVFRFVECRGRKSGLHVFRQAFGQMRRQRDFLYRDRFSAGMRLRQ